MKLKKKIRKLKLQLKKNMSGVLLHIKTRLKKTNKIRNETKEKKSSTAKSVSKKSLENIKENTHEKNK